jgi:hypothetical protein
MDGRYSEDGRMHFGHKEPDSISQKGQFELDQIRFRSFYVADDSAIFEAGLIQHPADCYRGYANDFPGVAECAAAHELPIQTQIYGGAIIGKSFVDDPESATIEVAIAHEDFSHDRIGFDNDMVAGPLQFPVYKARNDTKASADFNDRNVMGQPPSCQRSFFDFVQSEGEGTFMTGANARRVHRVGKTIDPYLVPEQFNCSANDRVIHLEA